MSENASTNNSGAGASAPAAGTDAASAASAASATSATTSAIATPPDVAVAAAGRAARHVIVSWGFRRKSLHEQIAIARVTQRRAPESQYCTQLVSTTITGWTADTDTLDQGLAREAALLNELKNLRLSMKGWTQNFRKGSQKVGKAAMLATDGDEEKMNDLGVPSLVVKGGAPPRELAAPASLLLVYGKLSGELVLTGGAVKHAQGYAFERSSDPPTETSWVVAQHNGRRRLTLKGLPPGQKMWFRVAANGAIGTGPWSQLATIVIR